jgi:hypothetical protein
MEYLVKDVQKGQIYTHLLPANGAPVHLVHHLVVLATLAAHFVPVQVANTCAAGHVERAVSERSAFRYLRRDLLLQRLVARLHRRVVPRNDASLLLVQLSHHVHHFNCVCGVKRKVAAEI